MFCASFCRGAWKSLSTLAAEDSKARQSFMEERNGLQLSVQSRSGTAFNGSL